LQSFFLEKENLLFNKAEAEEMLRRTEDILKISQAVTEGVALFENENAVDINLAWENS